jgi:hypothetical protein
MFSDFIINRHDDVMAVLIFLRDMTKSYSYNEIALNVPHIKDLPQIIENLQSEGLIKNDVNNKFRMEFKGADYYNNNTFID